MKAFTTWVVALILLLGLTYVGFETGAFVYLWTVDISKLCFAIFAIFTYSFLRLGKLLYDRKEGKQITDNDLDPGFESCDISTALGMLGTVIGFIFMSSSFVNVNFTGVESVRELFTLATTGMSTALYTTAVGLVSSILLRAGYYSTQRMVDHESKKV